MDRSSEADRVVQSVVSPSLLDGLLVADLSDWLPQIQWDLGVEGFDTPPFTPVLDPKESDELLLLASQQYESEFPDSGCMAILAFLLPTDMDVMIVIAHVTKLIIIVKTYQQGNNHCIIIHVLMIHYVRVNSSNALEKFVTCKIQS